MSAAFKQKMVDLRKAINLLLNHDHDSEYQAKSTSNTHNYLVNGNKAIYQQAHRTDIGDDVGVGGIWQDFYEITTFVSLDVNVKLINYSKEAGHAKSMLYTIGTTGTLTSENLKVGCKVYEDDLLYGQLITYSAMVKSNRPIYLQVGSGVKSLPHSGNGDWELLSLTEISLSPAMFFAYVNMDTDGITPLQADDYMEIGHEQLEVGPTFTYFEAVDETTQEIKCKTRLQVISGPFGTGMPISTTEVVFALIVGGMFGYVGYSTDEVIFGTVSQFKALLGSAPTTYVPATAIEVHDFLSGNGSVMIKLTVGSPTFTVGEPVFVTGGEIIVSSIGAAL